TRMNTDSEQEGTEQTEGRTCRWEEQPKTGVKPEPGIVPAGNRCQLRVGCDRGYYLSLKTAQSEQPRNPDRRSPRLRFDFGLAWAGKTCVSAGDGFRDSLRYTCPRR